MEINESSLSREITLITTSGQKPVHFFWRAEIHAGDETIKVHKVISLDDLKDYENRFADEMIISLLIGGGTYAKRIHPFRDNLEITVIRDPMFESGAQVDVEVRPQTERYRAALFDAPNPILEGNGQTGLDEATLNMSSLIEISFQLINKSLEQVRMITVGGVFRYTTVSAVIQGLLSKYSRAVDVENTRLPKGVDMVPASNQGQRDHIIIPHGLPLTHVPEYVHRRCGGVYSSGFGYYLQGDYWYIFPSYNTERFHTTEKTLTIINVPSDRMPGIERTFRKDGNNLVILATGKVKFSDDSEIQQLNRGNGVRFADADKVLNGFVKTQDNKAVFSRNDNNNEFAGQTRTTGLNNLAVSDTRITSNAMVEQSNLARRYGCVISLAWEHAAPEHLYPGMPVRMMYMDGQELRTLDGVLLQAHTYVRMKGAGMIDGRYIQNTTLSLFVRKPKV